MATKVYTGQALPVAQITTITIGGAVAAGNTVSVTINRRTATATAETGDTTALLASRLYQAIQAIVSAGTAPEFNEISWSDPGGTASAFTATSLTAGTPFTLTESATGGGATISQTATQAATGPNHVDNAANWDTNSLPVATNDIIFPPGCPDYLYGLSSLDSIAFGTIYFYGGSGGFPDRTGNDTDPNSYYQYRTKHLSIQSATAIEIGNGVSSPEYLRLKISGAVSTPIRIQSRGASSSAETFELSAAAGTAHAISLMAGVVKFAPSTGEVIEISTLRVGTEGPEGSFGATDTDPRVTLGVGATITTARVYGGEVESFATIGTSNTMYGGTWTQDGLATVGTVNLLESAGTYRCKGTGAHTAINARGSGSLVDFSPNTQPVTVTNLSITDGAVLINPQRINGTLAIDGESHANSRLGYSLTVTLTAA